MKNILVIILLTTLASCSFWSKENRLQKRNTHNYYTTSGVLQYFHQSIPRWINFRSEAGCFLNYNLRYLKMFEIKKNIQFDYKKAVQFQLMYNHLYAEEKRKSVHNNINTTLTYDQEEKLFYKVSQSIQSGIYLFRAPTFKRINLIWIDPTLGNKKETRKLKKLLKSKIMDLGHPVLVSECLSRMELETFINQLIPQMKNIRLISSEMFSSYNKSSTGVPYWGIDFSAFFTKKQKVYLYTKWPRPSGFKGKLITKKY